MRKILPITLLSVSCGALFPATVSALSMSPPPRANPQPSKFVFKDASGKATSVDVVQSYQPTKIARPFATGAKSDRQLDPKLMRAATIAEERAHAHSRRQCWHAVKEALLASGVISSRPKTEYAKQAGQELVNNYGFRKLPVNDWSTMLTAQPAMSRSGRKMGSSAIFALKRHPAVRCLVFSLNPNPGRWQFHSVLSFGQLALLAPEPDAQCAPDCSERNCYPRNAN